MTIECSKSEQPKYVTGNTWGRVRIPRSSEGIIKFGSRTGMTEGNIMFQCMAVKKIKFETNDALGYSYLLNQYEIRSTKEHVCQKGDSGALVFMKDCADELVCVGMITGVLDEKDENRLIHGVVTPITDILNALRVHNLKAFSVADLEEKLSKIVAKAVREEQKIANKDLLAQITQNVKDIIEKNKPDTMKSLLPVKSFSSHSSIAEESKSNSTDETLDIYKE